MSEMNTSAETIMEKKIGEYNKNLHDFVGAQELTVTITLSEYRDLLSKVATRQEAIDKANADKYTREQEIKAQKEANEKLKAENYELQKRVSELRDVQEKNMVDVDQFFR